MYWKIQTHQLTTTRDRSLALAAYNLFPACPHWRTNFLEEFLVGHELKFLSRKVHVHLVHDSSLASQQMTKCTEKAHTYLAHNSCLTHCSIISRYKTRLEEIGNYKHTSLLQPETVSQPWLLTTCFQLVPTGEQTFCGNSQLDTNLNSCPAKFMSIWLTTCVQRVRR